MRFRSLATATALAVATVPFLTSSALSADTTVGDAFVPTNVPSCDGFTFLLKSNPAPDYVVPSNGVITSWRTSTIAGGSAASRTLKVARVNSDATGYSVVATSSPLALPANDAEQTLSQPVRIPVAAGDVLGFSQTGDGPCGTYTDDPADQFTDTTGDSAVGATVPDNGNSGFRFSVAATLEPDADSDGFGDTSQDQCTTDATTQGACPVVTPPATQPAKDTTAPDTRILTLNTSRALGKKGNGKLRVTFTANENPARYRCSVDNTPLTPCGSTYGGEYGTKVKPGRHTFTVVATDAAGNTDTTPATQAFKVKKAKRK